MIFLAIFQLFQSPGIPWDATEKQIRNDFGECGEIEELAMPSKAVFITFKSKAGADKALEYDGDQYGKGTLQAKICQNLMKII